MKKWACLLTNGTLRKGTYGTAPPPRRVALLVTPGGMDTRSVQARLGIKLHLLSEKYWLSLTDCGSKILLVEISWQYFMLVFHRGRSATSQMKPGSWTVSSNSSLTWAFRYKHWHQNKWKLCFFSCKTPLGFINCKHFPRVYREILLRRR